MKYTGKKYVAIDNSYEVNLSNPITPKAYLAGTTCSDLVVTTIVSEPFDINYKAVYSIEYRPRKFVILQDEKGMSYMTLFYPHGVITKENTIEDMISRHEEMQQVEY